MQNPEHKSKRSVRQKCPTKQLKTKFPHPHPPPKNKPKLVLASTAGHGAYPEVTIPREMPLKRGFSFVRRFQLQMTSWLEVGAMSASLSHCWHPVWLELESLTSFFLLFHLVPWTLRECWWSFPFRTSGSVLSPINCRKLLWWWLRKALIYGYTRTPLGVILLLS